MASQLQHPLPLLELDVLRTFLAIAHTGSFTQASSSVLRTPSAVSMQIKKLEEQLGRSVFNRDARSVSLTEDGLVLLDYARRLLALNREAVSRFVAPSIHGVVNFGAPVDLGENIIPTLLKRLTLTHPRITVNVILDDSASLRCRMDDHELDAMLVAGRTPPDLAGAEPLFNEPIHWVGARGGNAYLRDPLPLSLGSGDCAWRLAAIEALDKCARSYRIAYLNAHMAAHRAAVLADVAIAPMPQSAIGADMMRLDAEDGLPPLGYYHIGLVVTDHPTPLVQAAADHIRASTRRKEFMQ